MRVAVLGLGLIGGSAALALAEAGHEVVGYDAAEATRRAAASRFEVASDPVGLRESEVAVVAVPMRLIGAAGPIFDPEHYEGIVTDVASVKVKVREELGAHPRFVGGHPMAGKETAGFAAAEAGLFSGRKWVLCLERDTDLRDWTALAKLWTGVGAQVVPATARRHDKAVAQVSHIEHLVAAALTLDTLGDPLAESLAAGSFRDATRVAASAPELVGGMVEGNSSEIVEAMRRLTSRLEQATRVAEGADAGAAAEWFDRARRLRAAWPREAGRPEWMAIERDGLLVLGEDGGWVESVRDNEVAVVRPPRVKSTP